MCGDFFLKISTLLKKKMSGYIIIIVLLFSGFLFRKYNILSTNFSLGLNKLLIYFFIPILTLLYLPEITFQIKHIWLIVTPWIIYVGAIIFFYIIHTFKSIPRTTRASLIMTSGIGSISFVGFPVFEFLYGKEGLSYGIILSLGGTFVVCNSIGILTGYWFKEEKLNIKSLFKGILTFPPFIAMLFSIILILNNYNHTPIVREILVKLSSPFSILALFSIGLQIRISDINKNKKYFFLGQLYKLLVAPIFIYLIFLGIDYQHSIIAKICILGAGIGSMNTIAIIASELNLNPKLSILMSGFGIPISIFSLFIIYYLIS
jgi:predicted permease